METRARSTPRKQRKSFLSRRCSPSPITDFFFGIAFFFFAQKVVFFAFLRAAVWTICRALCCASPLTNPTCLDPIMTKGSDLLQAGQKGDAEAIERLLTKSSALRLRTNLLKASLYLIPLVFSDSLRKIDPNVKDVEGYTALHFASLNGHLEACRTLLKRGANANSRDSRGMSIRSLN